MKVDFATFCHPGDIEKLQRAGQLELQVMSNGYQFDNIIIVHQKVNSEYVILDSIKGSNLSLVGIDDFDFLLTLFNINLNGQYVSNTDHAHTWKNHVVNHLKAVSVSHSDYIVFADGDCWMVDVEFGNFIKSWVGHGIKVLQQFPDIFIVSPNDGEPERKTRRMSQQMFMARTEQFRNADFNQPGWDGNTDIPGGPMPEYWGMLEGRMELHCRQTDQYRYVCPPEYRYWHHNRINSETDHYELDRSKY